MDTDEEKKLLDRLARVEGQVRGLRRMLEERRCCEDVLTQLLAARSGLESAGIMVVDRHLQDCVFEADNVKPETLEKVRETLKLISRHG